MNINKINKYNIEKMTAEFDNMVREGTLNISKIENLLTSNMDEYKNNINKYMESLISSHIDEKQLIIKKNKNGKNKDIN